MKNKPEKMLFILMGIFCAVFAQINDHGLLHEVWNLTIGDKIDNGQAVSKQINLSPKSILKIQVENISDEVKFLIIQAHTFGEKIIMGYNETFGNKSQVEGTNVGLILYPQEPTVYVTNNHSENINVLIAVVYYMFEGPIPGACDMEFQLEVSPFLKVLMLDSQIEIDASPASVNTFKCDEYKQVTYDAYRLNISEGDYSPKTYFSTIEKMITVNDITKNGVKVPASSMDTQMRRVYSAYPGIGSAYAMIARYQNNSAAYVTAFSYACSPLSDPDSCKPLNESLSKLDYITILVMGLFFVFIGHAAPNFEMFLWGSINGCLAVYILSVYFLGLTGWSMLIGASIGIISLILMGMKYSFIPTLQAALTVSFLITGILYFSIPGVAAIFENDIHFYMTYFMIAIVVLICFYIIPSLSNIFFTSFFGGYMVIMPIDYWFGSSLKFIMINLIRRMTIEHFSIAKNNHPFQMLDAVMVFIWACLIIWGAKIQAQNIGFITTVRSDTAFPTLSEPRGNRRVLVLDSSDQVSRNTFFN